MRSRRLTVLPALALLAASCTGAVDPGTTAADTTLPPVSATAAPPQTTSTTTTTSTTPPAWSVELSVDPAEAVAVGEGVVLTVAWDGGELPVDPVDGSMVLHGLGSPPVEVTLSYPAPIGGGDAVSWAQQVTGPEMAIVQPWRGTRPAPAAGVVLAWQWLGSTADYLTQLDAAPGLTVSSPLWWELDADGRLVDRSDPAFVAGAHRRGIDVWPALASLDLEVLHLALDDPADRRALAEAVSARAQALGVDGVNLDFEGYLDEDAVAVADFAALLGDAVRSWGGVLSVDLTVRSDDWVLTPPELAYWSTAPLRRELAEAADYVVLMAYDQHNKWRPAGPVAAPDWVEDVLRFQFRYVEPERVLLGVPFYGRVWDPEELDAPRAIGIGALERLAAGEERAPDPVFGVDRVDLEDGRFLWLEDAAGLEHRRRLVEDLGLAGLAGWRLGLDSPEVWPVLVGGAG